jgi:hypothetical protein
VGEVIRCGSPHPQPLPSGRGEPNKKSRRGSPSPGGEGAGGWGNGTGVNECAVLLLTNSFDPARIIRTPLRETLTACKAPTPAFTSGITS